jgi:putative membrane protein
MRRGGVIQVFSGLAMGGLLLVLGSQSGQAQQSAEPAPGQPSATVQRGQLSSQGENFLITAARIDMQEVQGGHLAQKKGTSPAVRSFAEHMINDHTKANTGLKEIAAQKSAEVPTQLSQKQDSTLQHLEGLSGASFDQAYAQDMVRGHEQAVKEFKWAAKNLSDPDLKAWAQTTLPLLQEHLRMAKDMQAAVKNEK